MRRRLLQGALIALLVITGGVSIEWLLLTGSSPQAVIAALQAPAEQVPVVYARPLFETGVVFPRWGADAYTSSDPNYAIGLNEIQNQTAARWIELTVDFYQPTRTSTTVETESTTPTPEALEEGIRVAHAHGFRVFVAPLLTVSKSTWAGRISFTNPGQASAWFTSYWNLLRPYLVAAASAGAEQFAIGTEYYGLEANWTSKWNNLISEAHSVFPGLLTYDVNFDTLYERQLPTWLENPLLAYIGVSAYFPLVSRPERVDPSLMPILWYDDAEILLDNTSLRLGKPILISEIGYRNSSDALFNPFTRTTTASPDPAEQAGAYQAALQNTVPDPHIAGIFFWAWSFPPFSPNWLPAAGVLHHWYTSPAA
jgi:hypothetical protein